MKSQIDGVSHHPVLYQDIIHFLRPKSGGRYIDCTLGSGGHAHGILEMISPTGQLLGIEIDPHAIDLAQSHLVEYKERTFIVNDSYEKLAEKMAELGWQNVDGILFDLGVSSMQLDTARRGFSFQQDAPLDMRFDPHNPISAAVLVNTLPERDLENLIYRFGEERHARVIAHAIVRSRPINSTGELAQLITEIYSRKKRVNGNSKVGSVRIHPATRTFQALRIAVNKELETLEKTLPTAIEALISGGRLAVISFHSLEDRIVKQVFRRESQDCICPTGLPICTCHHKATIKEINRKPIRPSQVEVEENPRARSARLRVAEKL